MESHLPAATRTLGHIPGNGKFGSQDGFDRFFVLAGNGNLLPADGNDIGSSEDSIGNVDQERAMDAKETGAQKILPLADAGLVSVSLTVTGHDPYFRVAGFHI